MQRLIVQPELVKGEFHNFIFRDREDIFYLVLLFLLIHPFDSLVDFRDVTKDVGSFDSSFLFDTVLVATL